MLSLSLPQFCPCCPVFPSVSHSLTPSGLCFNCICISILSCHSSVTHHMPYTFPPVPVTSPQSLFPPVSQLFRQYLSLPVPPAPCQDRCISIMLVILSFHLPDVCSVLVPVRTSTAAPVPLFLLNSHHCTSLPACLSLSVTQYASWAW